MTKKDSRTLSEVKIHGRYASEFSKAGKTRRIFHYRINIDHKGQNTPQEYERDIHICEQQQDEVEPLSLPDIAMPAPETDDPRQVNVQAITAELDTVENQSTDADADIELPEQADSDTIPAIAEITPADDNAERLTTTALEVAPVPDSNVLLLETVPPKALIKLPQIKPGLTQIKNTLLRIRPAASNLLRKARKTRIKPGLKRPKMRNIFTARTRQYAGKTLALLSTGLMAMALLYYFYPKTTRIVAIKPQPTTKAPTETEHSQAEYHAKIEQHVDGVTITIQGPAHEEVLTKLPPGYHPVLVGDKIVHVVTPGNTLWFIAKRYIKNPYHYPELARLNNIKNPDLIYPGNRVIIQHIRTP